MKLKNLRKIYRILFPLKFSEEQIFINKLQSNSVIKEFKQTNSLFLLNLFNSKQIYLRDYTHSDYSVFTQIFNDEEYKVALSFFNYNKDFRNSVMVDVGANVGYATMYFQEKLKFERIICVEPSISNFNILKNNIELLDNSNDVLLLNKAIAEKENLKFQIKNDFRDGKDWSITTKKSDSGEIQGITLNEIIKENNLEEITLLKIDIEGAERFIFQSSADLSFLNITKVIVIEIHDEFNIRENIYNILHEKQFLLIESGETTIGINKKYLN